MSEEWEVEVWVYADNWQDVVLAALEKHPGAEVLFIERYKEGQYRVVLALDYPPTDSRREATP